MGMDAALRLLGLGARGRRVVVGVEQVRAAAQRGGLALVMVASDASRHSRQKVEPLLAARGVAVVQGPTVGELGRAVGKESAAAVGVIDAHLADGVRGALGDATQGVQEGLA